MSLSDRERVEGFQRVPSLSIDPVQSERVEGFQRSPMSEVAI